MSDLWSGNQGTLSVYVSKAKDLPNLIKLDKQNVMLRLRIAHMTRESDTLLRAGQNPVFNYLEKFDITPAVKPVMHIEIYCDRRKKAPLPIGRCEIDLLNGIRADPRDGYCKWYELKRDQDEFAGIIFIELTFKPTINTTQMHKIDKRSEMLDASMASRPIPPLPTDMDGQYSFAGTQYGTRNDGGRSENERSYIDRGPPERNSEGYMHASDMRQVTPSINQLSLGDNSANSHEVLQHSPDKSSESNGFPTNFSSSVGTSNTSISQETKATSGTTTSETRFHFANLKKLKERINIFKNPATSTPPDTVGSSVDIEALQKAIGVTSLSDEEDDDHKSYVHGENRSPTIGDCQISKQNNGSDEHRHRERFRSPSKYPAQPELPPLPRDQGLNKSINLEHFQGRSHSRTPSPNRHYPKIPPLPSLSASTQSRGSSMSPTRRRPPPDLKY